MPRTDPDYSFGISEALKQALSADLNASLIVVERTEELKPKPAFLAEGRFPYFMFLYFMKTCGNQPSD